MNTLQRSERPFNQRLISPRRKANAAKVLTFLLLRGGSAALYPRVYLAAQQSTGLSRYDVNLALDDLYETNAIEMRVHGELVIIIPKRGAA
jgi:hypothetical protein